MDALMGSCLVEVGHIRIEDGLELPLVKDQQVVQAFLSYAPHIAFADRIGSWCMNRRFEDLDNARFRHTSKARPKRAVVIMNQILGCLPIRGRFSERYVRPKNRSEIVSPLHG
jgi:hypothetical protein